MRVRSFNSAADAARTLAERVAQVLTEAIEDHGTAVLTLTGGSSPQHLYHTLATTYGDALDWGKVHFLWGDERRVPYGHKDSNTATTAPLLDGLQVQRSNLHPWATEREPAEALAAMRDTLRELGLENAGEQGRRPDVTLLGMGPDGHVASLFPDHEPWKGDVGALQDGPMLAYIKDSPKPPPERYTFTFELLNRSRCTYLLPFGEQKRKALERFAAQDESISASHLQAAEELVAYTDLKL